MGIQALAHALWKMWLFAGTKVELWNKQQFMGNKNTDYAASLKNTVNWLVA